ncbi:MAG: redox-sensing transcriptional repressor Rex [Candidatus Omnitrophica bacterium]|nr:redox-sensing transcriptional repressor Rex [Candidatus Omnitrophota bacterium]
MDLPANTIERITKIYGYLDALAEREVDFVSSKELAEAVGTTDHTIRKDVSLLKITGYTRKGYCVRSLKGELAKKLELDKERKACIVGLGRLGTALLDYEKAKQDGFKIVAGFDCSINKLERIRASIDVFSMSELENIIKGRNIDLGIITVPAKAAQEVADQLIAAGIKGILNFSPAKIVVPKNIIYVDMDFTNALRFMAVKFITKKEAPRP